MVSTNNKNQNLIGIGANELVLGKTKGKEGEGTIDRKRERDITRYTHTHIQTTAL